MSNTVKCVGISPKNVLKSPNGVQSGSELLGKLNSPTVIRKTNNTFWAFLLLIYFYTLRYLRTEQNPHNIIT